MSSKSIILLVAISLLGCGETAKRSDSSPLTNVYAMNPFHRLSKEAQALPYPPGIDTSVFWGSGRFNVVERAVYDEEAKTSAILSGVQTFRQEGSKVYFSGDNGLLMLDLAAAEYRQFSSTNSVPIEIRESFFRLLDTNQGGNILIRD